MYIRKQNIKTKELGALFEASPMSVGGCFPEFLLHAAYSFSRASNGSWELTVKDENCEKNIIVGWPRRSYWIWQPGNPKVYTADILNDSDPYFGSYQIVNQDDKRTIECPLWEYHFFHNFGIFCESRTPKEVHDICQGLYGEHTFERSYPSMFKAFRTEMARTALIPVENFDDMIARSSTPEYAAWKDSKPSCSYVNMNAASFFHSD